MSAIQCYFKERVIRVMKRTWKDDEGVKINVARESWERQGVCRVNSFRTEGEMPPKTYPGRSVHARLSAPYPLEVLLCKHRVCVPRANTGAALMPLRTFEPPVCDYLQ